jgi:MFS family permease
MIPFALLNFLGPLALGRLFDTVGRRRMITFTYIFSALLLVGTGVLFLEDLRASFYLSISVSILFFFFFLF